MEWLKRLFNVFSKESYIDQTAISFKPPWILHPKHSPEDLFRKKSGEADISAWLTNWQTLSFSERQAYLKKWNVPEQWKLDFFQSTASFHDYVYGIACDNLETLRDQLFTQIIGQTIEKATFTQNSGLSLKITPKDPPSNQQNAWTLEIQRAAWQLIINDELEAASLDDPLLIEKHLAILTESQIEKISSTTPYGVLTIDFSNQIKLQTFTTQAVFDVGDINQWKLITPEDNILYAGAGKNLRYEIGKEFVV